MPWWRRAEQGRVGLECAWQDAGTGTTKITVRRVAAEPGCDFPHLSGVVLRAPVAAAGTGEWRYHRNYRFTGGDGTELLYRMPVLTCEMRNLGPGETRTYIVPAPADDVAGLLLGSLTTKGWIDDGETVLWLNNHDNQPGLLDFWDQLGTDPQVRIFDVDTAARPIVVHERETVRLSELEDADRDDDEDDDDWDDED